MSNYLASILQNVYDITTNNDITLIHLNTNSNNEWMQIKFFEATSPTNDNRYKLTILNEDFIENALFFIFNISNNDCTIIQQNSYFPATMDIQLRTQLDIDILNQINSFYSRMPLISV